MHIDPLARLADVETQQSYLIEVSSEVEIPRTVQQSESVEATEVCEIIMEDGDIIEGGFGHGFSDDWPEPDANFQSIEPRADERGINISKDERERESLFEHMVIDLTVDSDVEESCRPMIKIIQESSDSEWDSEDLSSVDEQGNEDENVNCTYQLIKWLIY